MAGEGRAGRRRSWLGGVRVRTTIAATVVVGVALLVGAAALVATMRDRLLDDLRSVTALRAEEIAASLEAGEAPGLAVADAEEQLVQVVDPTGKVLAASANAADLPPVARLEPGGSRRIDPFADDEFLVVAAGAQSRALTVLVARSVDDVAESTQVVGNLLALGLPVLLLLVAATTWTVTGRALRPVEAIRSEVEEISSSELHRRVPDPPGHDEVARLAATMNDMLGRLEAGQARQRRFVADASHELRSPLAAIRQHAEVAQAHPDRMSLPALADTVAAESVRLQHLVDDLFLLARADERAVPLGRHAVDVDDLVFDEARRLREQTTLRVDTARVSAGRVEGDPGGLRRVLRNLGDNAARHAGTTVGFALEQRDGMVRLTVEDDGEGIPEADRRRVLERFVRLDEGRAATTAAQGSASPSQPSSWRPTAVRSLWTTAPSVERSST